MGTADALRRPRLPHPTVNRWVQVLGGVVLMMAVAGLLFVWPLLRTAPGRGLAESLAAAENAFAAFILAETVFVPLEGWLGERIPRWLLALAGGALVAGGALASAAAAGPHARVAWSALGGVGAGLVYGATIAKALERFTDRKGLAAGVTAAACAGVLVLALGAIWSLSEGSLAILVVLGGAQAVVIVVATLIILYPPPADPPPEW